MGERDKKRTAVPEDAGEQIVVRVIKTEVPEPVVLRPLQPEPELPAETVENLEVELQPESEPIVPDVKRTKKYRRKARNVSISVFVLLLLLVGAGVVYTYFMGGKGIQNVAAVSAPTQTVNSLPKPVQPAANAPEGVALTAFSNPIAPGQNSMMQVRTLPGSTCSITVTYGAVVSTDSGLVQKIADDYGGVGWSWTVPENVPDGKYPVKVTCTYKGRSGVYQDNLVVSKTAQ